MRTVLKTGFSGNSMTALEPFLNRDEIHDLVAELAERISADYQDDAPVLVGVLKGSFVFLSDLIRQLTIQTEIDFVGASSYGDGLESSETLRLTKPLQIDIRNKDAIIIEDIIDTGLTLVYLLDYLKTFNPRDLKICALLDKRGRRQTDVRIDYTGKVVDEGFLVGYGLDYAERYRHLPELYCLKS